jgi:ABC-type transport system substrate-binding protein
MFMKVLFRRSASLNLLIASLAAVFVFAGCTKKEESATTSNSTSNSANVPEMGKKVFHYSRASDPKTLDPQGQLDGASAEFINSVYDRLMEYHYLKRPYQMVPSLLSEMPTLSKDGLTYDFKLKKGVKFIDDACFKGGKGRDLVADDVLYTIKRFADVNINTNSWFMLSGVIKGLDAYHAKSKKAGKGKMDHYKNTVSGLKKTGDYSFSITLTQKSPLALFGFAASSLSIVPHEAIEHYGRKFRTHPVGTGAFTLNKYKKKQTMVLVKNPNYHRTYPTEGAPGDKEAGLLVDAGKQLPLIDEMISDFIPEAQPTMLKFQKGDLSWVTLDKDNFTKMAVKKDGKFLLKPSFAAKYNIYTEPGLFLTYLTYNMKDKLVGKNKMLRKALSAAINTQELIDVMRNGRGVVLNTVVPHPIAGSELSISSRMIGYDLAKSKDYLAKAGFPGGKGLAPITITMGSTASATKDYFEFLRAAFAKIGVKVKGSFLTFPKYLKSLDSHNFEIAVSNWGADYPDAENFYQLFYGKSDANNSAFENPEFDKLYTEIRYMENSPERFKKLNRMSDIMKEEAPANPLYNQLVTGLIQKWVRNFKRNMMVDAPYAYVNLDSKRLAKGL